jgi:UMF1 family MFS transporter
VLLQYILFIDISKIYATLATMKELLKSKIVKAWTFYDWANSVYPLVITAAIFPIFYENVTSTTLADGTIYDKVNLFGVTFVNTELYSYVVSLSFLVIILVVPILSGIADYSGRKKMFLKFFCYLGALSCMSLYFFSKDQLFFGLLSVFMASIGYWGSLVFYNAYLPQIAPPELQDKISAKGFATGYIGSAVLLILNLVFIMNYDLFGFESKGIPTRLAFISVGLWWAGFAQITYKGLPPDNPEKMIREKGFLLKGHKELLKVFKELRQDVTLKRYLSSFFVYSMGVQTVMLMAVLFAKKEIAGLEATNLIVSVLLIQFVGVIGSHLFSFLSSKWGNIKALMLAVFLWILVCISTYLWVYTPEQFYLIAASVGLVMGGIQALSRSTYAKLLPKTKDHASYFSFFDISEKLGIVIGMFSFGFIEGVTGSMRASVLALIIFFIIGLLLLMRVPKTKYVY